MSTVKVWEVPVNVRASITLKVLADSKEAAVDAANEKIDGGAVSETANGGLDSYFEESPLTLDDCEVEEEAILESKDDPRQHMDWDPGEGESEDSAA